MGEGGRYQEIWQGFRDYCHDSGTFLSLPRAGMQPELVIPLEKSDCSITLAIRTEERLASCEVVMPGMASWRIVKPLEQDRASIEQLTGPLSWRVCGTSQECRIGAFRPDTDLEDRALWPEPYLWFKLQAELFHKTFSSRIKMLAMFSGARDEPAGSLSDNGSTPGS